MKMNQCVCVCVCVHHRFLTGVVVVHASSNYRSHVFQSSLNPRREMNAGVFIFGFL